jgi:hypothetical protein
MTDTNQEQLGNTLWSIADQLRWAMDADDFRDLAFMTSRIEENHFRGVTKMVPQVSTRRKPAAGLYPGTSSQGFLDYSNRRRKPVAEDSSATARSVAKDLFTQHTQGNRQGILDGSNRTASEGKCRGILGSSKGAPQCCRTMLSSAFLHPLP